MPQVFTYGSYMDADVLRRFGVDPPAPQRAHVAGWRLAFTPHANMLRDQGRVEGVLYELEAADLAKLYGPEGYVTTYEPVSILAVVEGRLEPAITFVEDAKEATPEPEYVEALRGIMTGAGLPERYIQRSCG